MFLIDYIKRKFKNINYLEEKWKRTYIIIITFYIFDYFSTILYCKSPNEEGGLSAYFFMKVTNSVPIGLTINIVVWATFWAIVIFQIYPYKLKNIKNSKVGKHIKYFEIVMFLSLGFFPSLDFSAATSWYWHAPALIRAIIGLILYLMSLFWIKPFSI